MRKTYVKYEVNNLERKTQSMCLFTRRIEKYLGRLKGQIRRSPKGSVRYMQPMLALMILIYMMD